MTNFKMRGTGGFRDEYKQTIGVDFGVVVFDAGNRQEFKLQIWSISSKIDNPSSMKLFCKGMEGAVIIYHCGIQRPPKNRPNSLQSLATSLDQMFNSEVPKIILAIPKLSEDEDIGLHWLNLDTGENLVSHLTSDEQKEIREAALNKMKTHVAISSLKKRNEVSEILVQLARDIIRGDKPISSEDDAIRAELALKDRTTFKIVLLNDDYSLFWHAIFGTRVVTETREPTKEEKQ